MFRHISTYFIGKIIPALFSLFIILFGYRIFGEEAYGLYALLFSTVIVVHDLTVGWIKQSILRYLSNYNTEDEPIAQIVRYGWLSSLITAIIILIVGLFYFKLPFNSLLWVVAFAVIYNIFQIRQTINQAQFKSRAFSWMETMYAIVSAALILALAFWFNKRGYEVFFIAFLLSMTAILMVRVFFFDKNYLKKSKLNNEKGLIKKMISFGGVLTIWMFLAQLFNAVDRYIIFEFLGSGEVGNYAAVYDLLFKISAFITMPVLITYHASIMKAWNDKDSLLAKKRIKDGALIETGMIVVFLLIFFLFKDLLFVKWMEFKGENLVQLALPIIFGTMAWQISLLIHKPLEIQFKQKQMLVALVVSFVFNVVTNIIFVPKYGYVAAAYTTLASFLLYMILVSVMVYKMNFYHEAH